MKALWFMSVPVIALLSLAVAGTTPATACASGCSTAIVDQLSGQYCTDESGGQIFVADGGPIPDGLRCGQDSGNTTATTTAAVMSTVPMTSEGATAVVNPTAGTMVTETISLGRTRPEYQPVTITLNGQYCSDKSGGVVFVPAGALKPDGVTC